VTDEWHAYDFAEPNQVNVDSPRAHCTNQSAFSNAPTRAPNHYRAKPLRQFYAHRRRRSIATHCQQTHSNRHSNHQHPTNDANSIPHNMKRRTTLWRV
jgi:hypothetical protein